MSGFGCGNESGGASSGGGATSSGGTGAAAGSSGASGSSSGGSGGASGFAGSGGTAGGSGGSAPKLACVPTAALDALPQTMECEDKHIVKATIARLPHDCHTQGIGFHPTSKRFVVTCQDQGAGFSGRVLSFPTEANSGGEWLATDGVSLLENAQTPHPSAIQITADGTLLVAMAKGSASGPSAFYPLRITAEGKVEKVGTKFSHSQSHVGAVGYANIDGNTHAIGCGWDCATLSLYSASGEDQTTALKLISHGSTKSHVTSGVDENVGAYNSLYLTERCEDGKPLLFASHGDWLDVWALSNLGSTSFSMSKIAKRQVKENVVKWKGRPIFYEGMTLEVDAGKVFVWAAPHDFGTDSCPTGTRCMQYAYRCAFGGLP